MKRICVDSGRSKIKMLYERWDPSLLFPAVMAPGHKIGMELHGKEMLSTLHVKIDEHEIFVGDFAVTQKPRSLIADRSGDKGSQVNRLFLSTAMGILADNMETIHLVTNTPAGQWALAHRDLEERYCGNYTINFLNGPLSKVKKSFTVQECTFVPEGAAAAFGFIYDPSGKMEHAELSEGKLLVIDIGDTTTNVVTMEDMEYIDEECFTLNLGMHSAHSRILSLIEKEYEDCNLTLPKLEKLLQTSAVYKHGVKNIQLQPVKERQYSELAESILYQLTARRKGTPDNVLLAGGGGAALCDSIKVKFPHSNVWMDPEKSAWLNVLGMEAMVQAGRCGSKKYSSFASQIKSNY
jgi:hypothetical protein